MRARSVLALASFLGILGPAASPALPAPSQPAPQAVPFTQDLPYTAGQPPGAIAFDLNGAVLRINLVPGAAPTLGAKLAGRKKAKADAAPNAEAAPPAELVVEAGRGLVRVHRPEKAPGSARLAIDATLAPGTAIHVGGTDLEVTIEDKSGAPASGGDEKGEGEAGGGGGTSVELALERSQVTLAGVGGVRATIGNSWLRVDGATGELTFMLNQVNADLRNLQGTLSVTAQSSEGQLAAVAGSLGFVWTGGSLDISEGQGTLIAQMQDAQVRLASFAGPMTVTGTGVTCEVHGAGLDGEALTLEGTGIRATIDGLVGKVSARLDGGSLEASGLRGETHLEGQHEADFVLSDTAGAVAVNLKGATARLSRLTGHLKADLDGAGMRLDGAAKIDLTAKASELTVANVLGVGNLQATDSRLDLDLTGVSGDPRIVLRGNSEGRVRLSTPCIVRVAGKAGAVDGTRIEVNGCDQNAQNQGLRTNTLRRNYGGHAVVLNAVVDETASLEVDGE